MAKRPKRPRDVSQLAKLIVDISTGEAQDNAPAESARAKAGRLGGAKGGSIRAKSLTAKQRVEIARKAAAARWKSRPK